MDHIPCLSALMLCAGGTFCGTPTSSLTLSGWVHPMHLPLFVSGLHWAQTGQIAHAQCLVHSTGSIKRLCASLVTILR